MLYLLCTGIGLGMGKRERDQWVLIYYAKMSTLVRDRYRDHTMTHCFYCATTTPGPSLM